MDLMKSVIGRRSFYSLSKKNTIPDDKIIEMVELAVKHVPSAFHNQSQMVVLLLGGNHDQLWDIAMETLRKIVPADKFAATETKINSFKAGYGTVLYFNDDSITKTLQESYPSYAQNFPTWAEQSNGMLQFAVWSILESEGLGASLQHYNPLIDAEVKAVFDLPQDWRLIAQMPFGAPGGMPDAKEFKDIHTRMKVFK